MKNKSKITVMGWMNRRLTDPLNYYSINENRDKHIAVIINDNIDGRLHFCCIYIPPLGDNTEADFYLYSDPTNERVLPDSIKTSFVIYVT